MARPSVGTRRQAILLGALAAILLLAVVKWRSGPRAAESPVPPVVPTASGGDPEGGDAGGFRPRRSTAKEISPDEVPILSLKDLGPAPSKGAPDGGRDLFELREPTRRPPPTPTPAPPVIGDVRFIGPPPPPSPTPTPHPPEVTFKFLGTFGAKDRPIAVLQQGEQIYNARAGDTLFGKFIVKKVGYESIDIGFVGFAPSETKRLSIAQ